MYEAGSTPSFSNCSPQIKEVKAYNLHDFQNERQNVLLQENRHYSLKSAFHNTMYSLLTVFPSYAGSLLIIIIGFYRIMNGDATFGAVFMVMVFAGIIVFPIQNFFAARSVIQNGWPAQGTRRLHHYCRKRRTRSPACPQAKIFPVVPAVKEK